MTDERECDADVDARPEADLEADVDEKDAEIEGRLRGPRAHAKISRQLLPTRQLELFRDKRKFEADTTLSAAERDAKTAEIDRKLADLNQQMAAVKQ